MILTAKQEQGLKIAIARFKAHERYTCIAGYAGAGKAQPVNTLIPTPEGMKKLGDLKIGDYVFDRTGNPTKILGIFPQGEKQCYKVGFANNQFSICAEDHLWSYYSSKGNLLSITTGEMLKLGLKNSSGYKYKIPQAQAVNYSHKNYEIDPYMIGVFLGDGCCKERYLTLSSENEEIPKLIGQIINATPEKNSEYNFNWTFRWNDYKKEVSWIGANNSHRSTIREKPKTEDYFSKYSDYLITEAYNKDIPEEYKYGDINQRLSLIQGLLDTDGSISNNDEHRYNVRFTSTSFKLVNSLQEVLNSLGYLSTITVDKRSTKYTTNCCYNLAINIPNEEKYKLFRLTRKKNIALEAVKYHKNKDYSKRAIVSIEPLDKWQEMVCIYVDNEEHLYLTNDYIVTHNTTLVKFIIAALGLDEDEVSYISYTGKAAKVLQQKGCPNAMTAHKLLYYSKQKANGKFEFKPRPTLENPFLKIIVLDEVSMLPRDMWNLLLSHRVYVLALGDPFQLPPIIPETDNHVLDKPHVFLDEIMRQALDSEIIRCSMWIREGKPLASYPVENKEVMVLPKYKRTNDILMWADQIICATNQERQKINSIIRELKGFGPEPEIGDKIINLSNHWGFCSTNQSPLTNGSIGTITNLEPDEFYVPKQIYKKPISILYTDMIDEDGEEYIGMPADYNYFMTGEKTLTPRQEYLMRKNEDCPDPPFDITYGYAITCHRAQGSDWNKVLVQEEWFPNKTREEHARWLYTAITRSVSRCVIIKK